MPEMTIAPVATHGFFMDGRWWEEGDVVDIRAPYDGSVIARIVQGVHLPADVIGGWAFGTLLGVAGVSVIDWHRQRAAPPPLP